MRPPKYDWDKIEQEFIHDNVPLHNGVTLKTIAEKYGIPYQTIRRKAAEDNWHRNRYFCWRMKNGDDATFYEKIDQQIKEIEKKTSGRCKETGKFMKGNQFALGNKGNQQPKYGNRNAAANINQVNVDINGDMVDATLTDPHEVKALKKEPSYQNIEFS